MKKGFVAITAAIALAATSLIGSAVAGIGPDRGLPVVNATLLGSANGGYNTTDTAVPGAFGSIMCVTCHTRNPAKRTAYNTANGNAPYQGSHFVTLNFGDTSKGGGYTDAVAPRDRASRTGTAIYMAASTATGFNWAGVPKYGIGSVASIDNATQDPGIANAQMICESCHNIVKNIGPAKLLATGFANGGDNAAYTMPGTTTLAGIGGGVGTQTPTLCIGCHGNMSAGVSAEWQLHPLLGGTWSGTHHHRNTPGTTGGYFGAGTQTATMNMASMDRAYYPAAGAAGSLQMWGAAYGELGAAARALTYVSTVNKKMQNAALTAAQGQIRVGAATQVLCTNCHRAHNAATTAGGTILMATETTTVMGSATSTNATSGMGVLGRANHIVNTNPLCLACHQ
jgi:hypothetical protein